MGQDLITLAPPVSETAFIHADSWVSKFDPQEYDEDESSVGHFQSLISSTYDESSSNTHLGSIG
jgi:hypothetical protein